MIKYIFSFVDRDEYGLFRDLTAPENSGRIDFLPSHKQFDNRLLTLLEQTALSYRLNRRFEVPFQSLFYNLDNYDYRPEHTYRILMPTTSIGRFTLRYLKGFKARHPNVELYAIVTDAMDAASPHMNLVRGKLSSKVWTAVLTYDRNDAREYGFVYFGYTCYSKFDDVLPDATASDIYYVGFDKGGRDETVRSVYDRLSGRCVCRFDVVTNDPKKLAKTEGMPYQKGKLPYSVVLARTKATNCILEVLQQKQTSRSMRWFEAIAYNKKLLTNNRNIADMPYYNPATMRYFETAEDIDIDWVLAKETIDYGYHGEFSPIYLIDIVDKLSIHKGR